MQEEEIKMLDSMAHRFARSKGYIGKVAEVKAESWERNAESLESFFTPCKDCQSVYLSIKRNSKSAQNFGLREGLWTGYLALNEQRNINGGTVPVKAVNTLKKLENGASVIVAPSTKDLKYKDNDYKWYVREYNTFIIVNQIYEAESGELSVLLLKVNDLLRIKKGEEEYTFDENGNRTKIKNEYTEPLPCYLQVDNYRMRDYTEGRDDMTKYTVIVKRCNYYELNKTVELMRNGEFVISSIDNASFDSISILQLTRLKRG